MFVLGLKNVKYKNYTHNFYDARASHVIQFHCCAVKKAHRYLVITCSISIGTCSSSQDFRQHKDFFN